MHPLPQYPLSLPDPLPVSSAVVAPVIDLSASPVSACATVAPQPEVEAIGQPEDPAPLNTYLIPRSSRSNSPNPSIHSPNSDAEATDPPHVHAGEAAIRDTDLDSVHSDSKTEVADLGTSADDAKS